MKWPTDDDEFYLQSGSDGASRDLDLQQDDADRAAEKADTPPVRSYAARCPACDKPFAMFTAAAATVPTTCPFCGAPRVHYSVVSPAGLPARPATLGEVRNPDPVPSGRRARRHRHPRKDSTV